MMVRAKQNHLEKSLVEISDESEIDLEHKMSARASQRRKSLSSTSNCSASVAVTLAKTPVSSSSSSTKSAKSSKKSNTNEKKRRSSVKKENDQDSKEEEEEEGEEEEEELTKSQLEEELLESLEYLKLQNVNSQNVRREPLCAVCESAGALVDCTGNCQVSYHPDCVGLMNMGGGGQRFRCTECTSNMHACFICKKKPTAPNETRKCAHSTCGYYYHDECAKASELFRKESKADGYICSMHVCTTCWCDAMLNRSRAASKDALLAQASKGKLARCVRCPTAYHVGEHCLAAGSVLLNTTNLVCPNHFVPIKSKLLKISNA